MAALVENTRRMRADHVCVGCRQSQAVCACLDCGDFLCTCCTTVHENFTTTKHHKVKRLSTMTAEKLSRSQPAPCCVHPGRPSELFCPTHGAAICHLCASSVHRACSEVTLFEKHLQELNEELTIASEKLKVAELFLEREINTLNSKLKDAEEKTNLLTAEIEKACHRLDEAAKALRKRLTDLALNARHVVADPLQEARADLLTRRARSVLQSPPGSRTADVTTWQAGDCLKNDLLFCQECRRDSLD